MFPPTHAPGYLALAAFICALLLSSVATADVLSQVQHELEKKYDWDKEERRTMPFFMETCRKRFTSPSHIAACVRVMSAQDILTTACGFNLPSKRDPDGRWRSTLPKDETESLLYDCTITLWQGLLLKMGATVFTAAHAEDSKDHVRRLETTFKWDEREQEQREFFKSLCSARFKSSPADLIACIRVAGVIDMLQISCALRLGVPMTRDDDGTLVWDMNEIERDDPNALVRVLGCGNARWNAIVRMW